MDELKRRYHDALFIGNFILLAISFIVTGIKVIPIMTMPVITFIYNVFVVKFIAELKD